MVQATLVDVRPVLTAATRLAVKTEHPHVGSEHLALLALGGPDGIEAFAAEAMSDPGLLRAALEGCCTDQMGQGERGEPRLTPRTVTIASRAAQLALLESASAIGPIHLAAALLDELGAVAWEGLRRGGVTPRVLIDGLERRHPVWLPDVQASTPAARSRVARALENPMVAWAGYSELIATDSTCGDAERQECARAHTTVQTIAEVAGWLGHISLDEAQALAGDDPKAANRVYSTFAARVFAERMVNAPAGPRPSGLS